MGFSRFDVASKKRIFYSVLKDKKFSSDQVSILPPHVMYKRLSPSRLFSVKLLENGPIKRFLRPAFTSLLIGLVGGQLVAASKLGLELQIIITHSSVMVIISRVGLESTNLLIYFQ